MSNQIYNYNDWMCKCVPLRHSDTYLLDWFIKRHYGNSGSWHDLFLRKKFDRSKKTWLMILFLTKNVRKVKLIS